MYVFSDSFNTYRKYGVLFIIIAIICILSAVYLVHASFDFYSVALINNVNDDIVSIGFNTNNNKTQSQHLNETQSWIDSNNVTKISIDYSMNNMWRNVFLSPTGPSPFRRIYISDKCNFIYFTTLKTGSMTTRKLINREECGFGAIFSGQRRKYWNSCGDHNCDQRDFDKIASSLYFKMLFVRDPISRFESSYNYWYKNIAIYLSNMSLINEDKELEYANFVEHYYKLIVENKLDQIQFKPITDHFQPIMFFICWNTKKWNKVKHNITCFNPTFVGKTETLHVDIRWIIDNKKFGDAVDYTSIENNIFR